jgi:squalene synthase HpnC
MTMGATTAAAARPRPAAGGENFPVALVLLPARLRHHLLAVYGVARAIDDLGDDPARSADERLADLDDIAADLRALWDRAPTRSPVVTALAPTVRSCGLRLEPFLDLVEANRLDQTTTRWATWDDLRRYCALSADPIGRLVLDVFGVPGAHLFGWSDSVCTALQLLEHCQDAGEDLRVRDRVYLPGEDMQRFGVAEVDLEGRPTPTRVRGLVAFEVERARRLLDDGGRLVLGLHGWTRVAVAGYVAGGCATADALQRASYDVLAQRIRPRRRDLVRHMVRLLAGRP